MYSYCLDDPINWVDPYGLKIVYKDKKAREAVDRLRSRSTTADDIAKNLEKSTETITIELTSGGNAYTPCTNTVSFNPSKTHIYSGSKAWHNRPPEVGLAHELIHAEHDILGTLGSTRMDEEKKTVGLGKYTSNPHTENKIRSEYGIPLRPIY